MKAEQLKIGDRVSNGTYLRGTIRGFDISQNHKGDKIIVALVEWDISIRDLNRYADLNKLQGFAALHKDVHKSISRKGGKSKRKTKHV